MRSLLTFLVLTIALSGCGTEDDTSSSGTNVDAVAADDGGLDGGGGADAGGSSDILLGTDTVTVDAGPKYPPGNAAFKVRGSVNQVHVWLADKGQAIEVRDSAGKVLAEGVTDDLGSKVFRALPPTSEVRVYVKGADPEVRSDAVDVIDMKSSLPPQSFYAGQKIKAGLGYLTTRDGTTLAYFATLPGPPEDGPYPTIVNYSGYAPAQPGLQVVPDDMKFFCDGIPVLCNAPADPSAMVAAVAGYATVSFNMRGTGCSGGAYDYFEVLQLLDGYDAVETVAAQPWVQGNKVGMVGLSYPGITQMFVAKTQPPSLAAIAPVSVIGNTATTLVPGGILNKGFALSWINNVYSKAKPYGQGWEQDRVDGGDTICEENQLLHAQRQNNVEQAKNSDYWVPEIIEPLDPTGFADKITVPVFLACAWQDEQTGPYFTTLLDKMVNAKNRRFMLYNGVHSDGFAPQVLAEWKAFLDLYVAEKKPVLGGVLETLVGQFTKTLYGAETKLPKDRWKAFKDHAEALAQWQSEDDVQVIFENGGGKTPGLPEGTFTLSFKQWPPETTKATRWFFQPDGSLAEQQPSAVPAPGAATSTASTFEHDPNAGSRGVLNKSEANKQKKGIWSALPAYEWLAPKKGMEAAFVTAPLKKTLVMAGTGSVDLWVRTPTEAEVGFKVNDADLEVSLTEVRPDGQEMYVQGGWLRASYRGLTKAATELWPENIIYQDQRQDVVPGQWTKVRVALTGFAHVFRPGSRIRVAVDTPGDTRVDWRFELLPWPENKTLRFAVAHSATRPSSIALPVLTGAKIPDGVNLPACPSLRGQPCRTYTALANVPFDD